MKKNITILVLSMMGGGAERLVSILLSQLKKEYNITLVMVYAGSVYTIPKDIKIIELGNVDDMCENGFLKLLRLFWMPFKYKKICKENKTDISFSFLNRANYINILSKLIGNKSKVIISERAMPSLQHASGVQGTINRFLIKNLYPHADMVTANSDGNVLDLKRNFGINNVQILNNMFDLNMIKQLSNETVKISFQNTRFTFITVGRLDNGKNHKIIIEAIKDIDANLIIVGDGKLKASLQELIKKYDLESKVCLVGFDNNPYKYMKISDCFVFTSLHEGFPNVLIEAMVCGLPIISTDCKSGPREILAPSSEVDYQMSDGIETGEYGILIPTNNKLSLIKAMKTIIKDKSLLKNYQKSSSRRGENFSVDKIITEYKEILCVV